MLNETPKSRRSISPVAVKPVRVSPKGVPCWNPWISSRERYLLGHPSKGELAVDHEALLVVVPDAGRRVGQQRVLVGVEEVGRTQVRVAVGVAGVDRRQDHRRLDARVEGVLGGHEGAGEVAEHALDLAHHEVADAEPDLGVGGVDGPGTRDVPGDGGGGLDCSHDELLVGGFLLVVSSTVEYSITN